MTHSRSTRLMPARPARGAALGLLVVLLWAARLPAEEGSVEIRTTTDAVLLMASDAAEQRKEEIVRALQAANPELSSADVRRSGDQVTLTLGVRGGGAVSLHLHGKKTDFYRLAAGENPEETLRELTRLDPQVRSTQATRSGRQLVLTIGYQTAPPPTRHADEAGAGQASAGAAGADTARMQAEYQAAMASGKPEAVQAFMAKWGSAFKSLKEGRPAAVPTAQVSPPPPPPPAPVPEPPKVPAPEAPKVRIKGLPAGGLAALPKPAEVAPPPAPAAQPPPPPKPDPAKEAEAPYRAALAAGTADALTAFLSQYPAAPQAEEARRQLQRLKEEAAQRQRDEAAQRQKEEAAQRQREDAAYQQAVAQNQLQALQSFVASYPNSARRGEVEGRIQQLQQEKMRGEMEQRAREAENDRRRRAFEQARNLNTSDAYRIFLATYPGAPEEPEAQRKLQELAQRAKEAENEKRRQAYEQAKAQNTPESYRLFAATYPGSPEEADARKKLLELEQRTRDAENDKRRRAFEQARSLDTTEAYRMFLASYSGGPEQGEAQRRLADIEADDDAYEKARRSEKALEAYLADRPHGRHADEARDELRQKREERMQADYLLALTAATPAALEGFLAKWPGSAKASDAKAALEALRQRPQAKGGKEIAAEAATAAEAPKEIKLVARPTRSAPSLDGKGDDAAWRDVAPVEVPLEGPGGRVTARVRALHDGTNLYLLAEWADGSRDTVYRPWVWNANGKKYSQGDRLDDGFSVALYKGEPPAGACMLDGANVDADIWLWRAHWSGLSGLADDGRMRVSRSRIPQANPYPARSGGGQVWIQETWDDGAPGWSLAIPTGYKADELPSYQASAPRGSRGDVRAAGGWANGSWTVEFARALDTGRPDDAALRRGETKAISFASFNKSDRGRHLSSPVVRMELRTK